jgi:ABC-2 type transport system permease protein
MFLLPLMLVFVITIIQDSAYRMVNDNNVSLLVSNFDEGTKAMELVEELNHSKLFNVTVVKTPEADLKEELLDSDALIAIFFPTDFTAKLEAKGNNMSELIMSELGVFEMEGTASATPPPLHLNLYYDPILQENYRVSISNMLTSYIGLLENAMMIESIFAQMEMDPPADLKTQMNESKTVINILPALFSGNNVNPNSTQHNVPAWTLFAMFFMVISLGGNIVKERSNGSFLRLKMLPTSMITVMGSKVIVYVMVAILQVALIFSLGKFTFPYIGLPELIFPSNFLAFIIVVLLSSLSAVSFALLIGTITSTQVQANGLGAVLVIIFAAIGGIWIPIFVMPEYMQTVAMFSPLYWCLEGFYILFLQGGDWKALFPVILYLVIFIVTCQGITILKLKRERLI